MEMEEATKYRGAGRCIGLIAGGGQFPLLFSHRAKEKGYRIFAAAYLNEADPRLAGKVAAIEWLHLGQVRRLLRFFKKNGVTEAVMVGTIQKTRMFSDVKPDSKAISLLLNMFSTHDDGVLRAFAALLEKEGIRIRPSTFLLPDLLATEGVWTQRRPNRSETADIALGWECARDIGRLDIGQCVVVGGGTILAVEAIEGTDAAISRGGHLGKGNAVAVKVCKPHQDMRFDVPAVGSKTIRTMHDAGVRALAVEAEKTVVFDRKEMIQLADAFEIAVVGKVNRGK
jgi:DUF1009 family protein